MGTVSALTSQATPSIVWALIPLLVFGTRWLLFSKQKQQFPQVEWLRISDLPGARGEEADANAYVKNGHEVICVGYQKFTKAGKSFMMRTPEGGQLVVHPEHIEEIRSAKEIDLHNLPANNELMQLRHTMHPLLEVDQYHFQVVQKQLTQSLGPGLPAIVDECMGAFGAQIGLPSDWKSVHMCSASFRIVTRTANRLLLGKELCANEEFLTLAVEYSDIFFGGANLIRHYPEWMKPWVMYFKTDIRRQQGIAKKHLAPLIKQRLAAREEAKRQGREAEFEKTKPSDTLQWVLDITPPEKMDINMLVIRLLHILVAAVHTSSVTFLNSMYDLALHPEIHQELRQEIRDVFASTNGEWTKPGLTKLMKLDSFIKESARFHPFQAGTMDRIAMRDYTLKDGTFIPKGTYMLTPSSAANFDPAIWGPDALEFDPWRFQKMRAQPGQETLHSLVQTSPKFTFFGHGKHACPGRFFAANEIKVLLVYTLMMYDVKFPENAPAPQMTWYSGKTMPDMTAHVLWRARQEVVVPWKDVSARRSA